ncbi:MAG: hypothetical protein WBO73_05050 [Gammaproteobacteria bacterium]|jgi:hypothetical protein
MKRQAYKPMVQQLQDAIEEVYPWNMGEELKAGEDKLLLDIRCPHE